MTTEIQRILSYYDAEPISIKTKLYQILMHGTLKGTGKLLILPVDQGFEHGPIKSFNNNPSAYDPDYFFQLAVDADMSAYAAPIGLLAASSNKFIGQVPTILKLNSNNSLYNNTDQAITASVKDALDLGCIGVGFTIYPGSSNSYNMIEEAREIIKEAKSYGIISVIWSYPRGEGIEKGYESAIDITSYSAHIAALLGAHIIKIKLPSSKVMNPNIKKLYDSQKIDNLEARVAHIMQGCFNGKRLVVFSGGPAKSSDEILTEANAINKGGGSGFIIGRNAFQRPKKEALKLLELISENLKGINNNTKHK